jgi:two-component system, OmpR family, alkaline phosphatase synthesis response regulator PhoP
MNALTILVVDDEKDIVDLLKYNLEREGYKVITAFDGKAALEKAAQKPDLILLDIMMPGYDGFEVCKQIRKNPNLSSIPVIFLTAKSSETDEVLGLELGADDYIEKPISIRKIIARIKNVLRKKNPENMDLYEPPLIFRELIVDKSSYTIKLKENEIFLPKKEFEILAFLLKNKGRVHSRESLLNNIWGQNVYVIDRTIDVHIRKIREKLGTYGDFIETIKGVGYRFQDE